VADELLAGFLDDYFAECEEHLTAANSALLALEASAADPSVQRQIVDDLFRFIHSLKGISAMVELRPAEQLAHELEHYLRAARAGDISIDPEGTGLLIEGVRLLERVVSAHRVQGPMPAIAEVVDRVLRAVERTPAPAAEERRTLAPSDARAAASGATWTCTFAPTRELLARGVGVDAVRKRLGEAGTILSAAPQVRSDGSIAFVFTIATDDTVDLSRALHDDAVQVERVASTLAPAVEPAQTADTAPEESASAGSAGMMMSHVVRVDLARLDDLMRHVGYLVISRARLSDALARIESHVPPIQWRPVQESALALDRQLRTLREGLMRVRLVSVGEIFRRMPFVVRDLARESGKLVELRLQGESTEIDKYLIERMMDPILHLVRNAVSHGIERPDERVAAGKPKEGTITLSASTAGDVVTIDIIDDGRGVDAAAVAARARRGGLPVPGDALDAAGLLALLCAPGFSTRDAADRASGRGVGMAVVKETVERLSGVLSLETQPGAGARFSIQLPLTLAVADALIGRVGGEAFAVPQGSVREVIEVAAADVQLLEGNEIIRYRDAALPIVRLSRLFGIDSAAPTRFHVFVVGVLAAAIGLAVDRIVGQREIVVRAITDPLVRVDGISGATDLGDGKVVLILDPGAIARRNRQRSARTGEDAARWGRLRL
jgi:two-component system chemotaxis sensor kinase CheA